jgi:hypothetical protein
VELARARADAEGAPMPTLRFQLNRVPALPPVSYITPPTIVTLVHELSAYTVHSVCLQSTETVSTAPRRRELPCVVSCNTTGFRVEMHRCLLLLVRADALLLLMSCVSTHGNTVR